MDRRFDLASNYENVDDVYHVNNVNNVNNQNHYVTIDESNLCALPDKFDATIVHILANWHNCCTDDQQKAIQYAKSVYALESMHFCTFFVPVCTTDQLFIQTDINVGIVIHSNHLWNFCHG